MPSDFVLIVVLSIIVLIESIILLKKPKVKAVLHVTPIDEEPGISMEMVAIPPMEELIQDRYFTVEVKLHES